eukprot:8414289-Alexandrium_andersonii.AAC.1
MVGPEHFNSYATIYAVVHPNTTEAGRIDMNRGITVQSSKTRQVPNAFNVLHQIKQKAMLGLETKESLKNLAGSGFLRGTLGLGPIEAAAVANLVTVQEGAVSILKDVA